MKKRLNLLIFLLVTLTYGMAQPSHIDSLKNSLKRASSDSARESNLNEIAHYFEKINKDSAIYYANFGIEISHNNQKKLNEAFWFNFKGWQLLQLGKFPESFECLQNTLNLLENIKRENYWNREKYTTQIARLILLEYTHGIMSDLMQEIGNYEEQLNQCRLVLLIAKQLNNQILLAKAYGHISEAYRKNNLLDSALFFEKKAEKLSEKIGDKDDLGIIYRGLALIYQHKNDEKLIKYYFYKAIKIDLEENNNFSLEDDYGELAYFYLRKKQKDSCLFYAKKTILALNENHSKKNLVYAYKILYKSYELFGKNDSTKKYQELAIIAKDSSFNATLKTLTDFQRLTVKKERQINELQKEKAAIQSRNKTYIFSGIIAFIILLTGIFYRSNLQKQKVNTVLIQQKEKIASQRDNLEITLEHLKATQTQLIQSEKMASLGELTAGIAHEIQNPLNFVNNFAEVSKELLEELKDELDKGDIEEAKIISDDVIQNLEKINHHGKRADAIVKGMLEHSRAGTGIKEPTDINKLADDYLRLSYHGLRAKDKAFNAEMVTNFDEKLPLIKVIPQDIGRVLLNLFNNAFYAVNQKKRTASSDFKSEVAVITYLENGQVIIKVKDNGIGIPDAIKDKIMQPFFTTKPTGEGTGLGLSLTYDMVVKGHGGSINIESKDGQFTIFTILLPLT